MDIRFKLYPYPVLAYFLDDYIESIFETKISAVNDGYNLNIQFQADLVNSDMENMLKEGKIEYAYHLECSQTGYRVVNRTGKELSNIVIQDGNVNGRLQICPFIVAKEDLHAYSNSSFNDDYEDMSFDIEAGCVIAVGRQINIDIEKNIDDLLNTSSIFAVVKNDEPTELEMVVNYDQDKIVVKMSDEDFYNYRGLYKEPSVQPMLNSMIVFPALLYVLEQISKMSEEDILDYEDFSWFRSLQLVISKVFDKDIKLLKNNNNYELAQKLLKIPITASLESMYSEADNEVIF